LSGPDSPAEVSIASSIVSNKGFIRTMSNGGTVLNATYVAVWGGMLSTGQLIGVGFLQFATDALGRKIAMHITWITLCVVSVTCLSCDCKSPTTDRRDSLWRSNPPHQTGSTGFSPSSSEVPASV
jgi:hypothetical protein